MQDLKITLVQANQAWEDKEKNLANYSRLLEGCDSDLIILPEMFQTGFSMHAEALAEEMDSSPSLNWLKNTSREKGAAIYTSLIIRDRNHYYNRGVFVEPNGNITSYDKRKTFSLADEDKFFSAGSKPVIVNYKDWKFQLQICYDLRFPELVQNALNAYGTPDYDVILYVANWPEKRITHWNTLLMARAIENQCYVVGVNRVGKDGSGLNYNGCSQLIDALGDKNMLETNTELAQTLVIKFAELQKTREKLPFLSDR